MDGGGVNRAADLGDVGDEAERRGGAPVRAGAPRLSRAGWLAVAGFSAVVVVAAAGVPASGLFSRQTFTAAWSASRPVAAVEVSVDSADVTVRPASGPAAESLRQTLDWSLAKPQVTESWQGETLVVSERCDSRRLFGGDACGATLDLAVPSGVPVHVVADSGSVIVRRMTGNLRVETQSGDVTFDSVASDLWARVESGSIGADRLRSLHVDAQTVSGDLTLGFAVAPDAVSGSVVSGSVSVTVPPGATYRVTGSTVAGNRQIADGLVDDASPRTIALDSQAGDTDLEYGPGL